MAIDNNEKTKLEKVINDSDCPTEENQSNRPTNSNQTWPRRKTTQKLEPHSKYLSVQALSVLSKHFLALW